jgi:large subunit ribosomal protein L10
LDRVQKEEMVTLLRETFTAANSVVVSHFSGLTAAEATQLRRQMMAAGAQFRVTKNSLARRALEGTAFDSLEDLFDGPTGVAFSKDPVAAAKASVEFAEDSDHLVILGGSLDGKRLSVEEVKALASLPSLDELRARFVSLLQRPATNIVSVVVAPQSQLARVFGAYGG